MAADPERLIRWGRAVIFIGDRPGVCVTVSRFGKRYRLTRYWETIGAEWHTEPYIWAKRRPLVSWWRMLRSYVGW